MTNETFTGTGTEVWNDAPTEDELRQQIAYLELEKRIVELKLQIAKLHNEILELTQPTIVWTGQDKTSNATCPNGIMVTPT